MPASSDYLLAGGVANRYMRIVNNDTAAEYVSTAPSTLQGLFTFNPRPAPGFYTTYSGPVSGSVGPPWTATGNTGYVVAFAPGDNGVALTAGGDIGAHSFSTETAPPFTPLFPAGSTNPLTGGMASALYDMGGFAVNLGGPKYRAIGTWDPVAGTGDVSTAFAQAVTDAGQGTVWAPNGQYNTDTTLQTPRYTSVEGASWLAIFQSSTANPIMQMICDNDSESRGSRYTRICIDGLNTVNALTGFYAVQQGTGGVPTARASSLDQVWIRRCGTGFRMIFTQGFSMRDCKFGDVSSGSAFGNTLGGYISDNAEVGTLIACDFRHNVTGLKLENSNTVITPTTAQGIYTWTLIQCHFESNSGKALILDGASNNTLIGCKFEQNGGDYVTLQNTTTRPDGNTFINCYFNGSPSVPTIYLVNILAASGTTFIGGFFSPTSNAGINIAVGVLRTSFEYCTLSCTITDAGTWTSHWSPIVTRYARTRFINVLTDQATIVVDPSLGELFKVTLAGNRQIAAASNILRAGQRVTFLIYQDSGGGHTLAWTNTGNESWIQAWSDTGNTASKRSTISFVYDDVTRRWIQEGAQGPYV